MTAAMDEIAAALRSCDNIGISPERVSQSLGPHRFAFMVLCDRPERVSKHEKRAIARRIRQTAAIFTLEQDCQRGRYTGALGAD